jgi:hypothetical protein
MLNKLFRSLSLAGFLALPLALTGAIVLPVTAQAPTQKPAKPATPAPANSPENETEDVSDPNNLRPLTQADSVLSLQGGQRLMTEASEAISAGKYDVAATKLQQARKVFNQLSNFHLQLANSFSGIDPKINESQRKSALATGQMRDEATYQLALVHRAQNQPELAVPLLIQIIRSQNPSTELGKKSYQQLYELGFVSIPYNPNPPATANAPAPASTNPNRSETSSSSTPK